MARVGFYASRSAVRLVTSTAETTDVTPTASTRSGLVALVLALCGTSVSLMQTLVVPLLTDFPELLGTSSDRSVSR